MLKMLESTGEGWGALAAKCGIAPGSYGDVLHSPLAPKNVSALSFSSQPLLFH